LKKVKITELGKHYVVDISFRYLVNSFPELLLSKILDTSVQMFLNEPTFDHVQHLSPGMFDIQDQIFDDFNNSLIRIIIQETLSQIDF
jgi:hypothetical protein